MGKCARARFDLPRAMLDLGFVPTGTCTVYASTGEESGRFLFDINAKTHPPSSGRLHGTPFARRKVTRGQPLGKVKAMSSRACTVVYFGSNVCTLQYMDCDRPAKPGRGSAGIRHGTQYLIDHSSGPPLLQVSGACVHRLRRRAEPFFSLSHHRPMARIR